LWPFRAATRAGQNAIAIQTRIARVVQIQTPFDARTISFTSGCGAWGSLPRHRDAQALVGRDQVVGVLGVFAEVDLNPFDAAVEGVVARPVVVAHRRRVVRADVGRLVAGEDHGHGSLDAAFARLGSVDVQRDRATLREPASVVGELHPHLVRPGREGGAALDLEALQAEQVVAVRRLPGLGVEAPAGERAALGDDDALGAVLGDDDLGRDRVRL